MVLKVRYSLGRMDTFSQPVITIVESITVSLFQGQFPHPEPNTDQSQDESTIQELWTKNLDMLKSGNSDDERENVITMSSIAACGMYLSVCI